MWASIVLTVHYSVCTISDAAAPMCCVHTPSVVYRSPDVKIL